MNQNDMDYMAGMLTLAQYRARHPGKENYHYVHLQATGMRTHMPDSRVMQRNEENKQFFGASWPVERNRFTLFKASRI